MKRAPNLPKVAEPAWHGPIGEAVARIAPATEADPVAVLVQILALFGAMVGNGPHVEIGAARHPPQIWPLVVGRTSAGRKGTSLQEAKAFARSWSSYAHGYVKGRMDSGLSTGEGLLTALGAPAPAPKGKGELEQSEPIAPDGKLTVTETEFARVLAVGKRDGNNLSHILRQLWDEGSGSSMSRAAPLKVDDAHLVVIAHVTPGELIEKLASADIAGGTANRFLLVASERPHLLPYEQDREPLDDLAKQLGEYVESARNWNRRINRDRGAQELWGDVYRALNADEPDGRLGAVLARGPAQTMRLALIYALADGAGAISAEHLLAGLAVWQYAAQTARRLFGGVHHRDDVAGRLAEYIASAAGGRSRTDISNLFSRNKKADEVTRVLKELEDRGDVTEETVQTAGRPLTLVHWTGAPLDAVAELLDQAVYGSHPALTK